DGPVVELVEVVGGVVEMVAPVEAEPADVLLDRVDVLLLFLDRVRVVEAQVAAAADLADEVASFGSGRNVGARVAATHRLEESSAVPAYGGLSVRSVWLRPLRTR